MGRRAWALDLGTTNTALAVWDEDAGEPRLVELPAVCRRPEGADPLEAPRLVPTVLEFRESLGLWDRFGAWPPIARRAFIGHTAEIGRPALERNQALVRPSWVPGFKSALATEPLHPVARVLGHSVSARQAARVFVRELLAETRRSTGERIRDLVCTAPVDV
jgi:molecular chaperone DnaK (HSP70)